LNTYPLSQENKDHEQTIINEILKNNGYLQQLTDFKYINKAPINPIQTTQNTQKDKTKWATSHMFAQRLELSLTYFGIQISKSLTK
jgi:hypothetical protein